MGIADIRNAFLHEVDNSLRCTTCELHTIQDGKNSNRLLIEGLRADGSPFSLDSGPFDPKTPPTLKAREMAQEALKAGSGFRQPPQAKAAASK